MALKVQISESRYLGDHDRGHFQRSSLPSHLLHPLLVAVVVLALLPDATSLRAAEIMPSAFLTFPCDGTAPEQRRLNEQSATWVINGTRAFASAMGCAVYRVPIGRSQLELLRLDVNCVPYRLEFSGDGERWQILMSGTNKAANPMQFTTQGVRFTAAQSEAAKASGYAWFRIRPANEPSSKTLQLRGLRLDVQGTALPPQFVRPSSLGQLAPFAVGPIMILVGVMPVLIIRRRWRIAWRLLGAGAALWAISVGLKLGFALLANAPMNRWLHAALPQTWANLALWCYIGLLTGIFECGIFLVAAPLLARRQWNWREALSLGVSFGAVEAVVLGAASSFPTHQSGIWGLTSWSGALVPGFERLLALVIHVAAVVMILSALVRRKWLWFGVSFAYKSATDGVAAWLVLSGTSLRSHEWLMEWFCFTPFALIGVLVLLKLRRSWMKLTRPERKIEAGLLAGRP